MSPISAVEQLKEASYLLHYSKVLSIYDKVSRAGFCHCKKYSDLQSPSKLLIRETIYRRRAPQWQRCLVEKQTPIGHQGRLHALLSALDHSDLLRKIEKGWKIHYHGSVYIRY